MKLKIGLPKGSLQEATFGIFKKAGYDFQVDSRSYMPVVDDDELDAILIRPQEIPRYVEDGIIDVGLTGKDWIEDNNVDVVEVAEFRYSKRTMKPVKVVLAAQAPEISGINSAKDLEGKRIATEYVRLTERWLKQQGVNAQVEFSWGACEVKVPDLADAIVVNTEPICSLRAHNLRIVDMILESTPRLICNRESWQDEWKRSKIENLSMLLTGALNAESLVGLKMNVANEDLPKVLELLPSLKGPTISPLSGDGWVAVETISQEKTVRDLIPKLVRAGAKGIVEYPLNKVIY